MKKLFAPFANTCALQPHSHLQLLMQYFSNLVNCICSEQLSVFFSAWLQYLLFGNNNLKKNCIFCAFCKNTCALLPHIHFSVKKIPPWLNLLIFILNVDFLLLYICPSHIPIWEFLKKKFPPYWRWSHQLASFKWGWNLPVSYRLVALANWQNLKPTIFEFAPTNSKVTLKKAKHITCC